MRSIQIQDSISGEWRVAPEGTRIRFNFTDRWTTSGQVDAWIDVSLDRDTDGVQIRGLQHLTIGAEAGNTVVVSADKVQGGMTEITRLRKRELELVEQINEARDTFGSRKRKALPVAAKEE